MGSEPFIGNALVPPDAGVDGPENPAVKTVDSCNQGLFSFFFSYVQLNKQWFGIYFSIRRKLKAPKINLNPCWFSWTKLKTAIVYSDL